MRRAKKAMLIGIDGTSPELLERFVREGRLPNIQGVMERGVFSTALACFPTVTAVNWPTVVSGAWPGTHGITGMHIHVPGDELDDLRSGFISAYCRAERLWDVAEREGQRSIILKFPGAWPPTIQNGIVVAGDGSGQEGGVMRKELFEVGLPACYSTESRTGDESLVHFVPASGWRNLPPSSRRPLETTISVVPTDGSRVPAQLAHTRTIGGRPSARPVPNGTGVDLKVLLVSNSGQGYDRAIVAREKDAAAPAAELVMGDWSDWLHETFSVNGHPQAVTFRFKLCELSPDGGQFRLYSSEIEPSDGFAYPAPIARELVRHAGPLLERPGVDGHRRGWIDTETCLEIMAYEAGWLARASDYLLTNYPWDLYFMQVHLIDYIQHDLLSYTEPLSVMYDPREHDPEESLETIARVAEMVDGLTGRILQHADEDTLVVILSDHGLMPQGGHGPDINAIFAEAGLLTLTADETGRQVVDWSRTRACHTHMQHIYLNVRGRDPQGVVEPGAEYDAVSDRIVDLLYGYRDPRTGQCPFAAVLKREDSHLPGMYGDRAPDLLFALKPAFCGGHSGMLPTARFGLSSVRAFFIMAGPGVRQGYRRPEEGMAPMVLTDVAPTMAHLLGLPAPAQSEGTIRREFFATNSSRAEEGAALSARAGP